MASAAVQAAEPAENGHGLLAGSQRDTSGRSTSTGTTATSQAGLLKAHSRSARTPAATVSAGMVPQPQPRPSLPAMRKEVVLVTQAQLAERRPSHLEPLSTFDLAKLKAWGKGWTPDRGKGAAPTASHPEMSVPAYVPQLVHRTSAAHPHAFAAKGPEQGWAPGCSRLATHIHAKLPLGLLPAPLSVSFMLLLRQHLPLGPQPKAEADVHENT